MEDGDTRARILEAASQVFCEKGFKKTTVREICMKAKANVAAVNYHFGDKKKLYRAVLTKWVDDGSREVFTRISEALTAVTSAKETLRIYITAQLRFLCLFERKSRQEFNRTRLLLRECLADDSDPTIFDSHMKMELRLLTPVIREIVGPDMPEHRMESVTIGATGILTHYFVMAAHDPSKGITSQEELDSLTEFLTTFIYGGLCAVRETVHA